MGKVFVPEQFEMTEEFYQNLAEYTKRNAADYLWIANPQEPYVFWRCTSLWEGGEIQIGSCRLFFGKVRSEDEKTVVFSGSFSCGERKLGCDSFTIDLTSKNGLLHFGVTASGDLFRLLDVNICFLMPSAEKEGEILGERSLLTVFANVPFSYQGDAVLQGRLSFCELLNPEVSYLLLPEEPFGINFYLKDGKNAVCIPHNGAKLVFERTAARFIQDGETMSFDGWNYYLGICGDFSLQNVGLVMGLYGGEFFESAGLLRFTPGQDALLFDGEMKNTDRKMPTTAWISLTGSYHSSPEDAPLYVEGENGLRLYEPVAAVYQEYSPAFPCFPWKHMELDSAQEGAAGENLLYEKRYGCLFGQADRRNRFCAGENEKTAITSNGLCVGFSADTGIWNWVGIANLAGNDLPDVRLNHISAGGRQAFLNKDCFIFAGSAREFGLLGQADALRILIDGWEITFSKEAWGKDQMFLMKYTNRCSIREYLKENKEFEAFMQTAYEGDGSICKGYEELVRIVEDQEFQGTLFMNAVAAPKAVSPETAMILTGIEGIPAVYTIVENGRIDAADGKIKTEKSRVSSFLHYRAGDKTPETVGRFLTVGVSVTITQSKVTDFRSQSNLYVQKLLGENVGNFRMGINGMLETVSGREHYRFTLESRAECEIAESAVKNLAVDDVQMLPAQTGVGGRFVLSGSVGFIQCEKADLFSWDAFSFEKLYLNMDAQGFLAENAQEMKKTSSGSAARDKSMAKNLGAEVTAYLTGQKGSPDERGWRSIHALVEQDVMEGEYNGLVWQISMGSNGSLGGDIPICLKLLTAWSGTKFYFGVWEKDLDALTLSGILRVGFGGMEIVAGERGLMLKLCNIGIKFLKFTVPNKSADLYVFGEDGKLGWYMGFGEVPE